MAASIFLLPQTLSSSPVSFRRKPKPLHLNHSHRSRIPLRTPTKFSIRDQEESPESSSPSSVAIAPGDAADASPAVDDEEAGGDLSEEAKREQQEEVDWKTDEEFRKFMGNPSIEAAIKLEKKKADRNLRELDQGPDVNPVTRFIKNVLRDNIVKDKVRLEKVEEALKALDLKALKSCFGFDTFFASDVRRFGDGGIFIENLRKPIEEVMPKLENKLSEAAGREVVLWFMEEKTDDITKQV